MTSDRQRQANASNAQKSTGPRTEEGKLSSSCNSITHGGYATRCLAIPRGVFAEDPDEVQAYCDEIIDSLNPRDKIERLVAEHVASACLNLRRAGLMTVESIAGADRHDREFASPFIPETDRENLIREQTARRVLEEILTVTARLDSLNSKSLDAAIARLERLKGRELAPRPDTRNEPNRAGRPRPGTGPTPNLFDPA